MTDQEALKNLEEENETLNQELLLTNEAYRFKILIGRLDKLIEVLRVPTPNPPTPPTPPKRKAPFNPDF